MTGLESAAEMRSCGDEYGSRPSLRQLVRDRGLLRPSRRLKGPTMGFRGCSMNTVTQPN
jgi:hypothetical protein